MPIRRIKTIDLLRGYFLFVIIIDHLGRFPGIFEIITGKGWLWVSAAEGFFLISGIMLGLIRGRKEIDKSFWDVSKKLVGRGVMLYLLSVGLTLFFSFITFLNLDNPGVKAGYVRYENIETFILKSFTLEYSYGWTDFLHYYAFYLVLSPLVIFMLRKGWWYVVLILSIIIWWYSRTSVYFLTWQILFFSGSIIGFYLPEIQKFIKEFQYKKLVAYLVLSISAITLAASIFFVFYYDSFKTYQFIADLDPFKKSIDLLLDKPTLPYLRLIIFYFWFAALFIIFSKFESTIEKYFGNFLFLYGENSLQVYVLHGFAIYFLDLILIKSTNIFENFLINCSVLGLIWILVKFKKEFATFAINFPQKAVNFAVKSLF